VNHANDLIWRVPADTQEGTVLLAGRPAVIHHCETATVIRAHNRDALDPMALGECRHCGQALPDTPTT